MFTNALFSDLMKQLYLLRHAKSSWEERGLRDFDRPLSEKGIKDCDKVRQSLTERGIAPEKILCSPALRTRSTAQLIFPDSKIKLLPELYLCSTDTLFSTIYALKDKWNKVAIVFHNYAITDFVNEISYKGLDNVKTSGFIEVKINGAWKDINDRSPLEVSYFNRKEWRHLSE